MHLAMLTVTLWNAGSREGGGVLFLHTSSYTDGSIQSALEVVVPVSRHRAGTPESLVGRPRACLIQASSFQNDFEDQILVTLPVYMVPLPSTPRYRLSDPLSLEGAVQSSVV